MREAVERVPREIVGVARAVVGRVVSVAGPMPGVSVGADWRCRFPRPRRGPIAEDLVEDEPGREPEPRRIGR